MEDKDPVWNSLQCTCGASGVAVMAHEPHCAVILIESLYAQLERVERETITKCAAEVQRYMDELSPQTSERHDGAFVCLTRLQKSMLALPSAKTATETE